jgi:ABC-2 type transport system ATP-binding protein
MIHVEKLDRYFGRFAALTDVSFEIESGQIIGLLGLNGAGKSTTLRCLAGLLAPSSGTITVDGVDMANAPKELRKKIGFLPENPPLYMDMTVSGFLSYVGQLNQMSDDDARTRLPEVLRLTHLEGWENRLISTLSHGYQKRVGIAQTIIHNPSLVILDEPNSGLDPAQIVEMREVIRGLREDRVILISSHNLTEISQTCDRLLILQDGKLIAEGSEADLAQRLGDTRVKLVVRGEAEAFDSWLSEHAHVQSHHLQSGESYPTAAIELDGNHREQLVADAVAAGFGIRHVESLADELEEIFLDLMRQGATS